MNSPVLAGLLMVNFYEVDGDGRWRWTMEVEGYVLPLGSGLGSFAYRDVGGKNVVQYNTLTPTHIKRNQAPSSDGVVYFPE